MSASPIKPELRPTEVASPLARILRVLLVGADAPTRWLLESGLSGSRHPTRAVLRPAGDMGECITAATSGEYDAVLLDLGATPIASLQTVTELSVKLPHDVPLLVLGEDNDYVFRKVLQLDDEEYQRYVDEKIVVDDYLDRDMKPV